MYLEKSDIAKLKELPIESVAERLGLRVERHKSLCPFHDDSHPSMTYNVRSNRFKCFVCDAHGGVIDLVEKRLGIGFKDACRWLADSSNVILSEWKPVEKSFTPHPSPFTPEKYAKYFERPFINQAAGEFLFEKRKLDPRVVRWCRLTSWKNWLQIPYYDIDGHLTGVQWRNLACLEGTTAKRSVTGDEVHGLRLEAATLSNPVRSAGGTKQESESGWKPVPRFRFPYGSQCHIYNLPVLKLLKPGEELYIAEGCSDCWSLLSSGHKAIAIPSATLLKPQDLEPLSALSSKLSTTFHMFPDADLPGERLFLKLKQLLEKPSTINHQPSTKLIRHQLPSGCKDYSDYYCACTERSRSVNVNC